MNRISGLLFIGDPHVSSRTPGYRKDDYSEAILGKLRFAMNYARTNDLLPVIPGDLFHYPRDNSNSVIGELITIFRHYPPVGIYGNHDVSQNEIADEDSLSLLHKAGCYHLLDIDGPWAGMIGDQKTVLGGTSWGKYLPKEVDPEALTGQASYRDAAVIWITHHDLKVPTYEDLGHISLNQIPGVRAVFNGHIHRKTESVHRGETSWHNLGNISRLIRSDFTREHEPSMYQISFLQGSLEIVPIPIPHADFDEAFHENNSPSIVESDFSETVNLIDQLTARRTASGAGLDEFLAANLGRFDQPVRDEILKLKNEVLKK